MSSNVRYVRFVLTWAITCALLCFVCTALPTDGVGGSDDGTSGLQRGDDAGFRDGDALLLHGFVDTRPVCIVHLRRTNVYLSSCRQNGRIIHSGRTAKETLQQQLPPPHLIELVDETDAAVGQHQSAGLQRPLAADRVSLHVGGQTDGRGALPRGEHRTARHLLHIPADKHPTKPHF